MLGTLGVAGGGMYLATSKIAGVGDWSTPTKYADHAAIAGAITGLAGIGSLVYGGKGLAAVARSTAKPAIRQAATGMAIAKATLGAGALAGGAMGILKSHERMEKPYVDVHVKSEIINSIDGGKSIGDTANSIGGFGNDVAKNIGDVLNNLNPFAEKK